MLDIFAKSFLVQAAWNAERMQNIGFLFAIRRSLMSIWRNDPENYEAAMGRAASFFNTHPYFTPAVIGVTIHMEEKIVRQLARPEEVESVKTRISPPLNALGSLWFWDHLKILSFLVALPLMVLRDSAAILAGAILFFVIFNFYHLRTRWVGLNLGLRYGQLLIPELLKLFPSRLLSSFRRVSAFLLGGAAPIVLATLFERLQERLPAPRGVDAFYIQELFLPGLLVGLGLTLASLAVMYFRWLSVYNLIAISIGLAVGVARWGG